MKLILVFLICFAIIILAAFIFVKHIIAISKGKGCKTCSSCANCNCKSCNKD